MIVHIVIGFLWFGIVCYASTPGDRPRFGPLPRCAECVLRESIIAPGVGFDVTPSYGTAAVRFHNGSIVNVSADAEHLSLMKRLSLESSRPDPQYPDNLWDELRYLARLKKRQLRKRLGLPATPQVEILSRIISKLHQATEMRLRQTISAAAIALPLLPGLTQEDITDAMEYAGLSSLHLYNYFGYFTETSATFAGMGYGLCADPGDVDSCEIENAGMERRYILAAGLSREWLSVVHTVRTDANTGWELRSVMDFELGFAAREGYADQEKYWREVQAKMLLVAERAVQPFDTVLLLGEEASNETFLRVLRDTFWVPQDQESTIMGNRDPDVPLYVAARGAAEFAKRAQVSPWGCKEPASCMKNRLQHGEGVELFEAQEL
ncbi:hypothetical protein K432DRAFT_409985 [Lepidopterella palustris CBS 459.81]|uniref:Uncharacterized protein n=1 Tax=Lepidopterella palustris CBS 459.81 TaxID=1314670 RepID=A0A8E2JA07_9PEZI|nr:hypothetical protein K432DRAFT_409985 [Lepidopterella palustris CBS 459.81]